jgi:hypothetical protein
MPADCGVRRTSIYLSRAVIKSQSPLDMSGIMPPQGGNNNRRQCHTCPQQTPQMALLSRGIQSIDKTPPPGPDNIVVYVAFLLEALITELNGTVWTPTLTT